MADLIQFLSAQRPEIYNAYEETKKGSQNTKKASSSSSSGSGLFASIRDSLVVPNDNLAATDVEKKESEEDKRFDGNGEDGEDLSPQPVTAGVLSDPNDNRMNDAEEESEETKAQKMEQSRISIFSMAIPTSLRSLVENVPFYEIAQVCFTKYSPASLLFLLFHSQSCTLTTLICAGRSTRPLVKTASFYIQYRCKARKRWTISCCSFIITDLSSSCCYGFFVSFFYTTFSTICFL